MPMPLLLGDVPVAENGYPVTNIQRVWQGKSVEVAGIPTGGQAVLVRPAGVTGPLLCRVTNIGPNVLYFYFYPTAAGGPVPGLTDHRLASGAIAITILKAEENYLVGSSNTSKNTVRVEFLNQEL